MGDFLFSTRRRAPGELERVLGRFLGPVTVRAAERHGDWGSLAWVEGAHDADVLVEDGGHMSLVIGDPLVAAGSGRRSIHAAGERALLHDHLESSASRDWRGTLDGHYALLDVRRTGGGRVVTDPFAFIAVFRTHEGGPDGGLVLGTHVDAVALAAGRSGTVDPVSAADLLANLTCTFPWTLYAGVAQCEPGAELAFDAAGGSAAPRVYWAPVESTMFGTPREAAGELRAAVLADVAAACGAGPAGLLLSGGEDSRAVLGAVPAGVDLRAVTYAEWQSREVRVARRVARAYGRQLGVGIRARDHYAAGFEAVASMVGAHHLFSDVHGWGLHRTLALAELPVVLGGLSCDSLLKGAYADGPAAVTRRPAGLDSAVLEEVARRRRVRRDRLAELRPRSADEWMSLWPLSMRKHGGNVDGNRRLFRTHEVFHANGVLDVAASVPTEWKLKRRLFSAALRPMLAPAWHVPHARFGFPWFGQTGNLLLAPGLGLARVVRALASGAPRARHAPWPKWRSVADHPALVEHLGAGLLPDSLLAEAFERKDRSALRADVSTWSALGRLMLAQLAYVTARARSELP